MISLFRPSFWKPVGYTGISSLRSPIAQKDQLSLYTNLPFYPAALAQDLNFILLPNSVGLYRQSAVLLSFVAYTGERSFLLCQTMPDLKGPSLNARTSQLRNI